MMEGNIYEKKLDKYICVSAENAGMTVAGKTRREIADQLGLNKLQIKNWINRHNKEVGREGTGLTLKRRET